MTIYGSFPEWLKCFTMIDDDKYSLEVFISMIIANKISNTSNEMQVDLCNFDDFGDMYIKAYVDNRELKYIFKNNTDRLGFDKFYSYEKKIKIDNYVINTALKFYSDKYGEPDYGSDFDDNCDSENDSILEGVENKRLFRYFIKNDSSNDHYLEVIF